MQTSKQSSNRFEETKSDASLDRDDEPQPSISCDWPAFDHGFANAELQRSGRARCVTRWYWEPSTEPNVGDGCRVRDLARGPGVCFGHAVRLLGDGVAAGGDLPEWAVSPFEP